MTKFTDRTVGVCVKNIYFLQRITLTVLKNIFLKKKKKKGNSKITTDYKQNPEKEEDF